MKFKFALEESRIYDFLYFPRLLYYRELLENSKDEHNFEEIVIDEYLDFVKKIEGKLKPFSKEIETFYMKQYLSDYDFIELISRENRIIGYKSVKSYMEALLTLDEHEIKRSIVSSIMTMNDGDISSDEINIRSEEISKDNDKLISFIKDLPLEGGFKWNLFLIVEKPIEYMKKYVNLMTSLLPIFEEAYKPFEDEIKDYGIYLTGFLNKNGSKGLKEISYSILDTSMLDGDEMNVLISVMYSYAVSLMNKAKDKCIVWGLRMEEAFKRMKEVDENKTVERIKIFKNLGDKTRYEVLKLIASGETSTKNIANALGVSSATISYHISNFLTSKVIKLDKANNKLDYVVDYDLLEEAIKGLKEDLNFPDE